MQQVFNIVHRYGRTIIRRYTPIRYATALPSTGYGRIRISGDCSYYWGTAAWQLRRNISGLSLPICILPVCSATVGTVIYSYILFYI